MDDALKRFTDTGKWNDPWFRALSPTAKLLWSWLVDHCDNTGVIDPDIPLVSFQIGSEVKESHFTELGDRLQRLPNNKLWIPKFIKFQFGTLTDKSVVHRSVIRLIQSNNLDYPMPFLSDVNGIDDGIEMGQLSTKDKEKDKDKGMVDERSAIALTMNAGIPEDFVKYVYQDWFSRDGRDAGGVLVKFLPYTTKRWARERNEWANGTHKAKTNGNGAKAHLSGIDKVLLKKELDAVEAEIVSIKGSYEYHQGMGEWSAAHRTRHAELKASRAELRNRLGMKA